MNEERPASPETRASTETPRERMARVIAEYDAQGAHRTGGPADSLGAVWLSELVGEAGFSAALELVPFEFTDVETAQVKLPSGVSLEGTALLDGGWTDEEGVRGVLVEVDLQADAVALQDDLASAEPRIVLVRVPPTVQYAPGFEQLRTHSSTLAMVAVTGGEMFSLPSGYALINADRYREPFGAPVLQLPSEAYAELEVHRSAEVEVVLSARREPRPVHNVTVTVAGRDPSLAPLVVMTPRSGWWECASERGGGLAIWVELLHALHKAPPARTVHFVASTGHELGHLGLDHYLDERRPLIAGAHLWLHLGANFAAQVGSAVRLQASSQELFDRAEALLESHGSPPAVRTPVGQRPYGEAREIFDGGGRFVSLLGGNGLFHSPRDRWPEAVDLDRLEALRQALVELVLEETAR